MLMKLLARLLFRSRHILITEVIIEKGVHLPRPLGSLTSGPADELKD